jgi:hypothetical protein
MAAEAGVSESDTLLRGKAAAAAAGLESQTASVANLRKLLGDRAFSEGPGKDNWYPTSALLELREARFPKQQPATLEQQLDDLLPGGPVGRLEHELELENLRLRSQVDTLTLKLEAAASNDSLAVVRLQAELAELRAENGRAVTVAKHFADMVNDLMGANTDTGEK